MTDLDAQAIVGNAVIQCVFVIIKSPITQMWIRIKGYRFVSRRFLRERGNLLRKLTQNQNQVVYRVSFSRTLRKKNLLKKRHSKSFFFR